MDGLTDRMEIAKKSVYYSCRSGHILYHRTHRLVCTTAKYVGLKCIKKDYACHNKQTCSDLKVSLDHLMQPSPPHNSLLVFFYFGMIWLNPHPNPLLPPNLDINKILFGKEVGERSAQLERYEKA